MKKRFTLSLPKGFTIIELLMMMGIILLLGGGVVAAFNNFNENQRVKQAALSLKSNLRLAQNKAISGEKPAVGCTTLVGYSVSFTATSYTTQAQCNSGPAGSSSVTNLPSGVSFVPVPSMLTFSVITGRIASNTTITLSGLNKTYSLTVAGSGNVSTVGF